MAIRLSRLAEDIRIASVENDHDAAGETSATGGSHLDLLHSSAEKLRRREPGSGSSSEMRKSVIHRCR
jgi:hypothetical protein